MPDSVPPKSRPLVRPFTSPYEPIVRPYRSEAAAHLQENLVPAFPEIDVTKCDGVFLETLRSDGINDEVDDDIEKHQWVYQVVLAHEALGHGQLDNSFLSILIRLNAYKMWQAIRWLCNGYECLHTSFVGYELYRPLARRIITPLVPLVPLQVGSLKVPGSLLGNIYWRLLVLSETAAPVQEAFAIWVSLYLGQIKKIISAQERKRIETAYKKIYGEDIRGFSELYDTFKKVAEKIGHELALYLCSLALDTLAPREALMILAEHVNEKIQTKSYLEDESHLRNMISPKELSNRVWNGGGYSLNNWGLLVDGVSILLEEGDLDHLRQANIDGEPFYTWLQGPSRKFNFFFNRDQALFFGEKSSSPLPEVEPMKSEMVFFESLRQQLCMGIGVQCPFWTGTRGVCCRFRSQLEGFLEHTIHREKGENWKPRGCLLEKP